MIEKLNIPLSENPIPQKIWGIMVFVVPFVLIALLVTVFLRLILVADTLSAFAAEDTGAVLRIIKTPKTRAILEDHLHGILLFPNAPWTADEFLTWTNRSGAIFLSDQGVTGIAVDAELPDAVLKEAKALGFVIVQNTGGTFIGTRTGEMNRFSPRVNILTLLPGMNGELYFPHLTKGFPVRLSPNALTVMGIGREQTKTLPQTSETLSVNIEVSGEEAREVFVADIPLTFPGLRALTDEMRERGFAFSLGTDERGTSYALSLPGGILPREELESAISELYAMGKLDKQPFENVYARFDEIVSKTDQAPTTTSDPGVTITSIADNAGNIVRAAESAHSLILSNRSTQGAEGKTNNSNGCLHQAGQWVAISTISELLPPSLTMSQHSLAFFILQGDEIAFKKSRTRLCW